MRAVELRGRGGRLKVLVPDGLDVVDVKALDELYGPQGPRRPDFALLLRGKDRRYLVIIEHTGRPNRDDLERLDHFVEEFRRRGSTGYVVIKVLHHAGLRSGKALLVRMARRAHVELSKCSDTLNLEGLMRRGLQR